MIETVIVPCDPGDYEWRATAIRIKPGEPWDIFLACDDYDRHLSIIQSVAAPVGVKIAPEPLMAKMVALFGRPWEEVYECTADVLDYQARMVANLTDTFMADIERASLEQIRAWVGNMKSASEGEFLRAIATGENPLWLRN